MRLQGEVEDRAEEQGRTDRGSEEAEEDAVLKVWAGDPCGYPAAPPGIAVLRRRLPSPCCPLRSVGSPGPLAG